MLLYPVSVITAEILCLGNELLIGTTVNTNATKISLELTKIGIVVTKHSSIRDEKDEIISELLSIRKRGPDVLVISGGLGITHDDIQLECIAEALKIPLIRDEIAEKLVIDRIKPRDGKLNEITSIFAFLPKGSKTMKNSQGVAPGILTVVDNKFWISLPGVPKEMNAILIEELIPFLQSNYEDIGMMEYGFNALNSRESQIIEPIRIVEEKYPQFYYKSHPKKDENGYWLAMHVYGFGNNIEKELLEACEMLKAEIGKIKHSSTTEVKRIFDENFIPEKYEHK